MGGYKRLVSQACPRPGHMAVSASSHFLPHGVWTHVCQNPPTPSSLEKNASLNSSLNHQTTRASPRSSLAANYTKQKRTQIYPLRGWLNPDQIKNEVKLKSTIIIHSTNVREVCAPHPYGPFKPAGSLKISLVTTAYGCSITRRRA